MFNLCNQYNVAKNSLKFKKKWQHVFSKEDGPSDEEAKWKGWDVNR